MHDSADVDGIRSATASELATAIAKVAVSPVPAATPVKARQPKRPATSSTIARKAGCKLARQAASERVQDSYVATYSVQSESAATVLGEMVVSAETLTVTTPRVQRKQARIPHGSRSSVPDLRYRQGSGINADTLRRYEYDTHCIEPQSQAEAVALERAAWSHTRRLAHAAERAKRKAERSAAKATGEHTPVAGSSYHHASLTLRS